MNQKNTLEVLGIFSVEDKILLFSRRSNNPYTIFVDESTDGFVFHKTTLEVKIETSSYKFEKIDRVRFLRVFNINSSYYLSYLAKLYTKTQLFLASSSNLKKFVKIGPVGKVSGGGVLIPVVNDDRYLLVYGGKEIKITCSTDLSKWKTIKNPIIKSHSSLHSYEIGTALTVNNKIGIVFFEKVSFDASDSYLVKILFIDKDQGTSYPAQEVELLWRMPEEFLEKHLNPIGIVYLNNVVISYWLDIEGNVYAVPHKLAFHSKKTKKIKQFFLNRLSNNPILKPLAKKFWESRAVFNPAALYDDGKVHLIYRAIGDLDTSVMGYATSSDGVTIDFRSTHPIYVPTQPFETPETTFPFPLSPYMSGGGGYGGCEDPRIVKIDNRIYMTYVAYDGRNPPRIALTSIALEDFRSKNWNWEVPILISPPGIVNKNACLLPEKVNGKYVMFHRVFPDILIDYLDDLNFDGRTKWLKGEYRIKPRKYSWDSRKLGVGAPPVKTKDGWLTIYQGVGDSDPGRYKIGAMLLDLKNPRRVLYRNDDPILSPDMHYENEGHKAGVVYPCGAVDLNGKLIVYYGGADTVVCAAQENLDTVVSNLKQGHSLTLRKVNYPNNAYTH